MSISPTATGISLLARSGAYYICRWSTARRCRAIGPRSTRCSARVAGTARANAIGVILTGMGGDGAAGLREMRDGGAHTIGQDESSCLIYGMPKVAKQMGAVACELPLDRIAQEILDSASREVST